VRSGAGLAAPVARDADAEPRARRRYHFHFPGVLYVCVTLFLAVGAVNSQNNLLFFALGLAIGGLLVSGVLSGASLLGVRLERLAIPTGAVGEPLTIRYRLSNSNALVPAFGLHIEEIAPARQHRGHTAPGWRRFVPAGIVRAFAPHVPARGVRQAHAVVTPARRGTITFDRVQVWSTFPFGLAKKSTTISSPHSGLVHPAVLPLRPGVIARITAKAPYGLGGQRSQGLGEEFFGLREYAPGDPPRNIAWKPSARTGTLLVRQYSTPAPSRLWLVLAFPAEGAPARQEYLNEAAIALGASILSHADKAGVAVGLAVPCAGVLHPPRLNRWHLDRMLGDLALLEPVHGHTTADPFPEAAARSGACVIVHAGPVDGALGPSHAVHFNAAQAAQLLQDTPHVREVLGLIERSAGVGRGDGRPGGRIMAALDRVAGRGRVSGVGSGAGGPA
jgi:uncharacterized protein (DUF58 family)